MSLAERLGHVGINLSGRVRHALTIAASLSQRYRLAPRSQAQERRMHELALMESVVESIVERIEGERVCVVRLAIGELAGVSIDALRFCFEVCANETALAGARLEIEEIAGSARCRNCGVVAAVSTLMSPCTCGSFDRELLAGNELRLKNIEVQ